MLLTQYFWPETSGPANRLTGLAQCLVKLGFAVGVITGMPNYPQGRIRGKYRKKVFLQEELAGVQVFRSWLYTSTKKDTFRRLLNYLSFVCTALAQLVRIAKDYELVLVSSPPLFLGIAGVIYHWVLRIPLVFDVRDIWPDVFAEMGVLNRQSWAYRLAQALEEFIYSQAALITVVTEGKRAALIKRGIAESKIVCIPNGFDREFLAHPVQTSLKADLGLSDKFVVLYAGLLGKAQGIETIFQAAEQAQQTGLHFLLVGEGVEKAKLIQEAGRRKLHNVTFLAEQPRAQMLSFLKMADIVLVPLKSANLRNSVPSKLYEALAAGCPVVLVAEGDAVQLLEQAQTGLAITPDNLELLCSTFEDLAGGKLVLPKGECNPYILEHYARDKIAEKLALELHRLVSKTRTKGTA